MPTADARRDLAALLLELYAAPFTVTALRGKHAGTADLTLRVPNDTVKRFWAIAKALKEEADLPATGGSDGHGWGATAPDIDGDCVRYGVGG